MHCASLMQPLSALALPLHKQRPLRPESGRGLFALAMA